MPGASCFPPAVPKTFTAPGGGRQKGRSPTISVTMGEPSGMTNQLSGSGDGTRFSATVKRCDPAKGYGFLAPAGHPGEPLAKL